MGPYALAPGKGDTFDYGIPHTVKLGEVAHGRGAAIFEYTTRHGEEPPLHTHQTEDEVFYVLEGELTFHCEGEAFDVKQGGCMFLPMGKQHGYTIAPGVIVRLLAITFPVREPVSAWGGYVADVETQGEKRADG